MMTGTDFFDAKVTIFHKNGHVQAKSNKSSNSIAKYTVGAGMEYTMYYIIDEVNGTATAWVDAGEQVVFAAEKVTANAENYTAEELAASVNTSSANEFEIITFTITGDYISDVEGQTYNLVLKLNNGLATIKAADQPAVAKVAASGQITSLSFYLPQGSSYDAYDSIGLEVVRGSDVALVFTAEF
jgi:hypothetical protein